MAKLSALKDRVGALPPLVGRVPGDDKAFDRERSIAKPWRAWYRTAKWQALRRRVFERDNYTCVQTGELLVGRHPAPNSPVADHIKPHRGDPALFWDITNLQTVSKGWHDAEKQRQEGAVETSQP